MICQTLTLKSIQARPVVLKLKRPVVARIATLTDWPLILIDLYTDEGVCQRRRENVSAGRSKTASRRDAKCPHGKAFATRQTG
jgi:hypothetical protein